MRTWNMIISSDEFVGGKCSPWELYFIFLIFYRARYDFTNKKNVELDLLDAVGQFRDFVGRYFRPGRAVSSLCYCRKQRNFIL